MRTSQSTFFKPTFSFVTEMEVFTLWTSDLTKVKYFSNERQTMNKNNKQTHRRCLLFLHWVFAAVRYCSFYIKKYYNVATHSLIQKYVIKHQNVNKYVDMWKESFLNLNIWKNSQLIACFCRFRDYRFLAVFLLYPQQVQDFRVLRWNLNYCTRYFINFRGFLHHPHFLTAKRVVDAVQKKAIIFDYSVLSNSVTLLIAVG